MSGDIPALFASKHHSRGSSPRVNMAKNPDDRYQSCGDLRGDLRGGPTRVRSARSSAPRPAAPQLPPPDLFDDDLRLLLVEKTTSTVLSLRDLDNPEPANAPLREASSDPSSAVVLPHQRNPAAASHAGGATRAGSSISSRL